MKPDLDLEELLKLTRRDFLTTSASGIGGLALASILGQNGFFAPAARAGTGPMAVHVPHFPAKAKACICIYMEGGPSQMDLFDPKPKLVELDGQKLPDSMTKNVRFAFLQKDTARIMASHRKFEKHGQSGMEFSDLLPNLASCADDICMIRSMHTEQFNHHPGQIMMNCGSPLMGRPSMGAWVTYGLGSESDNLPGYVVLTAGRGTSAGAQNWASGFLPTSYAGVLFRSQGDPVQNLSNPPGLSAEMQHYGIDAIKDLNALHEKTVGDPEIAARIASYELAFRMQSSAPELMDISGEPEEVKKAYGIDREEPTIKAARGGGVGSYKTFAKDCLLARRLVERGVRFVNIFHASWDHHSNLDVELPWNAGMADQPIAALIKDLKQRGLLDTTMVVWLSEFGRTPLGENRPGYAQGHRPRPSPVCLHIVDGGWRGERWNSHRRDR
ncbi:protein of unknown function DUF1501 [Chthoniobacter flavus Ellin428]|uniref:Sulfatase n=1 Tax=Chthoniobacter flavus Ellin428 TaxID=497964 RepID=B4D0C2_9BACT|nr:protein of unknown function DUF1501 [Chthoniobacter flavus Ellin428]